MLAVFIQMLVPHKYVGWCVMLLFLVAQLALDRLGFEHNLYQYARQLAGTPLSDMNGAGRFRRLRRRGSAPTGPPLRCVSGGAGLRAVAARHRCRR